MDFPSEISVPSDACCGACLLELNEAYDEASLTTFRLSLIFLQILRITALLWDRKNTNQYDIHIYIYLYLYIDILLYCSWSVLSCISIRFILSTWFVPFPVANLLFFADFALFYSLIGPLRWITKVSVASRCSERLRLRTQHVAALEGRERIEKLWATRSTCKMTQNVPDLSRFQDFACVTSCAVFNQCLLNCVDRLQAPLPCKVHFGVVWSGKFMSSVQISFPALRRVQHFNGPIEEALWSTKTRSNRRQFFGRSALRCLRSWWWGGFVVTLWWTSWPVPWSMSHLLWWIGSAGATWPLALFELSAPTRWAQTERNTWTSWTWNFSPRCVDWNWNPRFTDGANPRDKAADPWKKWD